MRPSYYRENNNCIGIDIGKKTDFDEKTIVERNILAKHLDQFEEAYL